MRRVFGLRSVNHKEEMLMPTFTNQAFLSYNGRQTQSNIVTGQLTEVLTATKTAVNGTYRPGDVITYAISLVNSSASALTGLTLSDDLGGYGAGAAGTVYPLTYVADSARYYQNGVLQAAPTVTAGPPMSIASLTVPASGNALLIYDAQVNEFAPAGTTASVTNIATLTGPGLTEPVTASENVTAAAEAALSIVKSLCPATVAENGQITYTFLIQNSGSLAADAAAGVVVSDRFTPILRDLTVTLNGTALAGTGYTYDAATGQFDTVAGVVTVPAATYAQDVATGAWSITPGLATLVVTGTL